MKLAFRFPVHGSQSVDMMAGIANVTPAKDTFEKVPELIGEDLWSIVENGPVEVLDVSTDTQRPMAISGGTFPVCRWRPAGNFLKCLPGSTNVLSVMRSRNTGQCKRCG